MEWVVPHSGRHMLAPRRAAASLYRAPAVVGACLAGHARAHTHIKHAHAHAHAPPHPRTRTHAHALLLRVPFAPHARRTSPPHPCKGRGRRPQITHAHALELKALAVLWARQRPPRARGLFFF